MSYMTISSQENHHFSLCSYLHAHPTTLLFKIVGGTNAWAVPHLKLFWGGRRPLKIVLGGPSPQFPLGLRPWHWRKLSLTSVSKCDLSRLALIYRLLE